MAGTVFSADLVNGLFEAGGGLLVLNHCRALWRDKEVKGVSVVSTAVFTSWGFWNLYFYPHLGQWLSFLGGLVIVIANGLWLAMMLHYTQAIYRLRYALRLWRRSWPHMSIREALAYPCDPAWGTGYPVADADAEIDALADMA